MDRGVAVVLTAAVGGLIALQAPINSKLGKAVGTFQGAFVSFAVGTLLLLLAAALAKGSLATIGHARTLPWYYLLGGVFGAFYVTTVLVTVRSLGAAPVVAATIAGQLAMSLVVDQFGLLGVTKSPITAAKVLGVLLLAAGVFLIVRD